MTSDPKRMLLESLWLPVGSRPCGSNNVMLGALGCCIHSMVHCLLLQILNIAIVIKIVGTCKKCVAFSCVDSFRSFQGLGISFLQNALSISAR